MSEAEYVKSETIQKLKRIFLVSIPVFVAHGIEEYAMGFYDIDPLFKSVFSLFDSLLTPQIAFLLFQIIFWIVCIIFFLSAPSNLKTALPFMTIIGGLFILEMQHLIEAIRQQGYYPGLVTAILFLPIGFFFWKELIRGWQELLAGKNPT